MHPPKSRLTRIAHVIMALSAVFAFGAVMASVAQAEETKGPFWTVAGTRLGTGETKGLVVKAFTESKLTAGSVVVSCKKMEAKSGQISGAGLGESGKGGGSLRYSECEVTGNGASCKAEKGEEVTKNLRAELVEDAATKKVLLVDFLPATGKEFAELKFEGTCTFKTTKVTGIDVLAEVLTDPGELTVELGGTSRGEAKSWLLKVEAPQPSAFWLIKGGKGEEVKIATEEKLEAFGAKAELTGTALGELTGSPNWSPLA